jgi:hypothetical protein
MAAVATMLAGLASSEVTRAKYDRSLAAQQQSKAGDQRSFFQAKRLHSAFQRNTAELLHALIEVHLLEPATLRKWAESTKPELSARLDSRAGQDALGFLQRGEVPPISAGLAPDPKLKAALDGLKNLRTDQEMAALLAPIDNPSLEAALRTARDQAQAFDEATKPVNQTIDQVDVLVMHTAASVGVGPTSGPSVSRDFTVARLRYTAARYEVEARLNQAIANLYELQVRKSNFSAERHHARSQKFFYGMLGAQLGVIVSTFAMAARNRNLLWSLAAVAGQVATAFAIYVYPRSGPQGGPAFRLRPLERG